MADVDRILQVQRFGQRRKVVGVSVHLVAIPGLARPAVTAAIMGYRAKSTRGEKHHLVFPGVRAQRPAMTEDYGLTCAPVLVVDCGSVFRRDRGHQMSSVFSHSFRMRLIVSPASGSKAICLLARGNGISRARYPGVTLSQIVLPALSC